MPLEDWKLKYKEEIPDDVMELHRSCNVVDLHIDTFMLMRHFRADMVQRGKPVLLFNIFRRAVDEPRLRAGGVNVPCWGVVVFPFRRSRFFDSAMKYIDMMHEWHRAHPDLMKLAFTGGEVREITAAGGIAGIIGMEGAHPLMGKMENLDALYERGVRYMTLTHFSSNEAAICATDKRPKFTGLTDFGRDVVARCDELGLIIDVAHVSRPSFLEATRLTKNPVIVSHTGIRGVKDMWRNIDDDQIDAVADTGGVIGIMMHSSFIGGKFVETLDTWAEHAEYVRDRVGPDHVAIGSDLDGAIVPTREFQDIADMPLVTNCLVRRGWDHEHIRKLLGENALRVFDAVLK